MQASGWAAGLGQAQRRRQLGAMRRAEPSSVPKRCQMSL
jgi:hypothetical protein